jgi:15-cis-phytoene synthase
MIRKGSKSFSLAARLFDPDIRDGAFFLYGSCRYCDDQIDQHGKTGTAEELAKRVKASRTVARPLSLLRSSENRFSLLSCTAMASPRTMPWNSSRVWPWTSEAHVIRR